MKKVVDANYFQDPSLESYLRSHKGNKVVLVEHAFMEAYKGDAVKNIYRSIRILAKYPAQVIALRSTREIIGLQNSSKTSSRQNLEDPVQTKGFKKFCVQVERAVYGNEAFKAEILRYGELATQHFNTVRRDAAGAVGAIEQIERSFHQEDLKLLRRKRGLSEPARQKVVRDMLAVAGSLFRNDPNIGEIPQPSLARDTFLFRYAISCYLLTLRWLSKGAGDHVSVDRLRNDIVDMSYVSYATFFDGLLSKDRKMQGIYWDTRYFLENVFRPNETDWLLLAEAIWNR